MNPPWQADYHVNINIQMNYWPVEVCNLSECHEPLFDFTDRLLDPGRKTARTSYGCGGFVVHFTTNAWHQTALGVPGGINLWQGAAGWLARHYWEHYLFTGGREFLRKRAYPVMKEAAQFYLDYMMEDPRTGQLMAGPASSPENTYQTPDGGRAAVDINPAMSAEIIRDLFSSLVRAGDILGADAEFRKKIAGALARMAPLKIGRYGQIQEWSRDFEEVDAGHRHMSQLYALHPGCQVTPRGAPGWPWPPGRPSSAAWRMAAARPAGAARGSSTSSRVSRMAALPTSMCWCCCAIPPCRIHSTPIRPSRSTATSAARRASPRCCCKAMPVRSASCRRCRRLGRKGASPG
ncbi:MAG: hypothetical protein ABSG26_20560 [Bryobacteraceae bacterium]